MEFRKGILFVRLTGDLIETTVEQLHRCLNEMLYEKGVRYFVINWGEVQALDSIGMEVLEYYHSTILSNDGKMMFCGFPPLIQKKTLPTSFLLQMDCKSSELAAFQLIHV